MATEKRLIDANELVDTIYKSDEMVHSDEWETYEIVDQINRIQTVDAVEVVHGRWEREHDGARFVCSNCRLVKVSYEMLSFFISTGRWKYCPNCGAKMDGERNNK